MGPGRKIYHKVCLKCTNCGKRLDSGSLLEHDLEPYCKLCHVKLFGTRDLRSANLSPSRTPPKSSPSLSTGSPRLRSLAEDNVLDDVESSPSRRNVLQDSSIPLSDEPEGSDGTKDGEGDAVPLPRARPPLQPSWTGSAAPQTPLRMTSTGTSSSSPVKKFGVNPMCPRCDKAVYFAEQVKASGKIWHKNCLRCSNCSVLLDSNRLTEKDGDPLCRQCYSKLHGPQGSGYALLGR